MEDFARQCDVVLDRQNGDWDGRGPFDFTKHRAVGSVYALRYPFDRVKSRAPIFLVFTLTAVAVFAGPADSAVIGAMRVPGAANGAIVRPSHSAATRI